MSGVAVLFICRVDLTGVFCEPAVLESLLVVSEQDFSSATLVGIVSVGVPSLFGVLLVEVMELSFSLDIWGVVVLLVLMGIGFVVELGLEGSILANSSVTGSSVL